MSATPPPRSKGLRPFESESLPAGRRAIPSTSAQKSSPMPIHRRSASSPSTTNSGTSAERTPKSAQPFANPLVRAARYAGKPSAVRSVIGVSPAAKAVRAMSWLWARATRATVPATASVPAYTKNGARNDHSDSGAPTAGPAIPPIRKPACTVPLACPRWSWCTTRSSRLVDETEKRADPAPPTPRRTRSWTKECEKPARRLETATTEIPLARMSRSPNRSTSRPPANAETNRMRAKTLMTEDAAKFETPNDWANTGIAGATMPKPRATHAATTARTRTSRGSFLRSTRWRLRHPRQPTQPRSGSPIRTWTPGE